ncbi:MAG: hypothetical protein NTZ64_08740, partial [Polaromonas sp.]|nr:hypothetical protein [Polaromonas sp.]
GLTDFQSSRTDAVAKADKQTFRPNLLRVHHRRAFPEFRLERPDSGAIFRINRMRSFTVTEDDDRLAAQVVGYIGGSGIAVWFQHRKRTGKDAWNRKVSGVFFCFFSP